MSYDVKDEAAMILTSIQRRHACCVRWLCGQCQPEINCTCMPPTADAPDPTSACPVPAVCSTRPTRPRLTDGRPGRCGDVSGSGQQRDA